MDHLSLSEHEDIMADVEGKAAPVVDHENGDAKSPGHYNKYDQVPLNLLQYVVHLLNYSGKSL